MSDLKRILIVIRSGIFAHHAKFNHLSNPWKVKKILASRNAVSNSWIMNSFKMKIYG